MYLFFDTETTGLPKDYGAHVHDVENWPRMVQLAFIHCDKFGKVLSEHNYIISPDGFEIPEDVVKIHGLTTEVAKHIGFELKDVLDIFETIYSKSEFLIAHNINFDKKIIGAELIRAGKEKVYENLKKGKNICTMTSTSKIVKLKSHAGGNKWPKLQELHKHLFGFEFKNAHDALVDVKATARCFFELKRLELI